MVTCWLCYDRLNVLVNTEMSRYDSGTDDATTVWGYGLLIAVLPGGVLFLQ